MNYRRATLPALLLLALAATPAHALFKVVGPDGRVTYTDRAPGPAEGRMQPVSKETGRASDLQLPYALRQVASRFPVTLYTAVDCGDACTMARSFLSRRGVPYAERTAKTTEEREAWERIVGGTQAPTLTVGSQSLRGFAPAAWDETLDVAGYPKSSLLPASWQPPAPVPLIAPRAAAPNPVPLPLPAAREIERSSDNPAGIRF
jgi:glutaredoxin